MSLLFKRFQLNDQFVFQVLVLYHQQIDLHLEHKCAYPPCGPDCVY